MTFGANFSQHTAEQRPAIIIASRRSGDRQGSDEDEAGDNRDDSGERSSVGDQIRMNQADWQRKERSARIEVPSERNGRTHAPFEVMGTTRINAKTLALGRIHAMHRRRQAARGDDSHIYVEPVREGASLGDDGRIEREDGGRDDRSGGGRDNSKSVGLGALRAYELALACVREAKPSAFTAAPACCCRTPRAPSALCDAPLHP